MNAVPRSFDRVDIEILALLQEDNRLSLKAISARCGLSETAVARRIATYRDQRLIAADASVLDPAKFGETMSATFLVLYAPQSREAIRAFQDRLRDSPNVQVCLALAGRFNLCCIVICRDMRDLAEFEERHFAVNAVVQTYETFILTERIKFTAALPLVSWLKI